MADRSSFTVPGNAAVTRVPHEGAAMTDLICPTCGAQGWQEYLEVRPMPGSDIHRVPGFKHCPNEERADHGQSSDARAQTP